MILQPFSTSQPAHLRQRPPPSSTTNLSSSSSSPPPPPPPPPSSSSSTNTSTTATTNRDSNMIRASVLDVALELGLGGVNSAVADWMFNNPTIDESEESEAPEPNPAGKANKSEDSHSTIQSAGAHNNTNPNTGFTPSLPPSTTAIPKTHPIPPRIQTQLTNNNYHQQYQYHIIPPDSPFASSTVPIPFPRLTAQPTPEPASSTSSKYGLGFGLNLGSRSRSRSKLRDEGSDDEGSDNEGAGGFMKSIKRKEKKGAMDKGKKEVEAALVREAQMEAKAAKAREKARKVEEKARKVEVKKEKNLRKSKSKTRGGTKSGEEDDSDAGEGDRDGEAYHSEGHSSLKVKKSTSSFFRRKVKVSLREGNKGSIGSAANDVPPLPPLGLGFPTSGLGLGSAVPTLASPASGSASGFGSPLTAGSGATSPNLGSNANIKNALPPIAARFATTTATPPPPLPVPVSVSVSTETEKEEEKDAARLKSTSPLPSQGSVSRARSPIPPPSSASTPTPTHTPAPTPTPSNPKNSEKDDTRSKTPSRAPSHSPSSSSSTASTSTSEGSSVSEESGESSRRSQRSHSHHSSEMSTPTSLPTSASTSASTSTSTSTSTSASRSRGMFGFVGGAGKESEKEREARKVKLSISLPLTRGVGPVSAGSSPAASGVTSSGNGVQIPAQVTSQAPPPVIPPRSKARSKAPMFMSRELPSNPSPVPPANNNNSRKTRPTFLTIQHPHEYNGALHSPTFPHHHNNNTNNHNYNNSGDRTRSPSPLRSPRRLHFPVAPPTPPPTGPLPSVPPLAIGGSASAGGHMRRVKAPSSAPPSRAPPPIPDVAGNGNGNGPPIQRGRESPFPSRPSGENGRRDGVTGGELPRSFSPSGIQRGRELPFPRHPYATTPAPAGFDVPLGAARYRGLHPPGDRPGGTSYNGSQVHSNEGKTEKEGNEDEDDGPLDPETLMNEFNLIRKRFNAHDRERFSAASVPVTEPDRYKDSFVSGGEGDNSFSSDQYQQLNSFSFSSEPVLDEEQVAQPGVEVREDKQQEEDDDDRSLYPDDDKSAGRRTMYLLEGRDSRHFDGDNRFSRYSAAQSVYSVLDKDRSEEARERFVRRVTAMYGAGGREVPPIPKLPDGLIIKGTGVGRRRIDV